MKWLKTLFVQRFSALDVVIVGSVLTSDVSLVVGLMVVLLWSAASAAAERYLNIRNANGNTPMEEL